MFSKVIEQTPFTTETACDFFNDYVDGSSYNRDFSFVSTLRALVYPRMNKETDRIYLKFTSTDFSKHTCESHPGRAVMNSMYDDAYYDNGSIVIHNIYGMTDGIEASFDIVERVFLELNKTYTRIEKVTDFYRKVFKVVCFVDADRRRVVLFTEKLNTKRMHYLQCSIFAFMPWYFNPKDGVTEEEMNLIQSLRETTGEKYMVAINKLAEQYDFRTQFIKNKLNGFEVVFENQRKESLESNIRRYLSDIERIKSNLADILEKKRNAEISLTGINLKIAEHSDEDSEIMEYFICNKKLHLRRVSGTTMDFVVEDYLTYYDEEMANRIIDNPRSYVYSPNYEEVDHIIEKDDMKMLMEEIFIEQNLKIKMCCAYRIELGRRASGIAGYNYGDEFGYCIPNPHIDKYNCLGDYERVMNERLVQNDVVGVIEQCVASCKSINFADSAVMNVFMNRLYGLGGYDHNRCIELPNGEVVKPVDAVKWLKEQRNSEEQKGE